MAKQTTRYHINKNGVPAACQAKKQLCPLGGEDKHFSTKEEAQAYADKLNESRFGMFGSTKPKQKQCKLDPKKQPLNKKPHYEKRKRLAMSQEEIRASKDSKSYFHKIRSISFYNEPIRKSESTYHFEVERGDRIQKITELIGEGTPIDCFKLNDGRRRPQIQEIYDNGKIVVYDIKTHKRITTFVAKKDRMASIYERAGVEPPSELIKISARNEANGYNGI